MTLIATLIAVAIDRLALPLQKWRDFRWLHRYAEAVVTHFRLPEPLAGSADIFVILLPVLVVLGTAQWYAVRLWGGWPGLVLGTVVLFLCLGPRDLAHQVNAVIDALDSGDPARRDAACGALLDTEPPEDAEILHDRLVEAVVIHANDRLFAVLFWFAVLGPLGAALYRMVSLLHRYHPEALPDGPAQAAWRLLWVLDWLPARLTALTYALAGSFDGARHGWQDHNAAHDSALFDTNERLLAYTGKGALYLLASAGVVRPVASDLDPYGSADLRAALALVWRALVVWLVVVAVLTLVGWAS